MKVLFVAEDPGGANAIVPIIERLRNQITIKVIGASYASAIFSRQKITAIDATKYSLPKLKNLIATFKPACIVGGTSNGPSLDKKIFRLGLDQKILTIAVVDFWSGYLDRFSTANKKLGVLPNLICVIDKKMLEECVAAQIPRERLVITGSPYLDETIKKLKPSGRVKNQLVFISQPFKHLKTNNAYDEITVLNDVFSYPRVADLPPIIIKLHPKENQQEIAKLLNKFKLKNVTISRVVNPYELIRESRLVLGMNSIMLLESSLAGLPTLSYQPGIKRSADILPSNRFGLSQAYYTKQAFYRGLDALVESKLKPSLNTEKLAKLKSQILPQKPVDKIIKLIYTSLNQSL